MTALFHSIHVDVYQGRDANRVQVKDCLRLAETTGHPGVMASASWTAGMAYLRTG